MRKRNAGSVKRPISGETAAPEIAIIDGRVSAPPPSQSPRSICVVGAWSPRRELPEIVPSNVKLAAHALEGTSGAPSGDRRAHDQLRERQVRAERRCASRHVAEQDRLLVRDGLDAERRSTALVRGLRAPRGERVLDALAIEQVHRVPAVVREDGEDEHDRDGGEPHEPVAPDRPVANRRRLRREDHRHQQHRRARQPRDDPPERREPAPAEEPDRDAAESERTADRDETQQEPSRPPRRVTEAERRHPRSRRRLGEQVDDAREHQADHADDDRGAEQHHHAALPGPALREVAVPRLVVEAPDAHQHDRYEHEGHAGAEDQGGRREVEVAIRSEAGIGLPEHQSGDPAEQERAEQQRREIEHQAVQQVREEPHAAAATRGQIAEVPPQARLLRAAARPRRW